MKVFNKKVLLTVALLIALPVGSYGALSLTHRKPTADRPPSTETPAASDPKPEESMLPTGTTPSEPSQTTPPSKATDTAPAPKQTATVTAYQRIQIAVNGDTDCRFTYSDGTTFQWHWQTVNEHGSWVTDSSGNNGHWVASTTESGVCDQSTIGKAKD